MLSYVWSSIMLKCTTFASRPRSLLHLSIHHAFQHGSKNYYSYSQKHCWSPNPNFNFNPVNFPPASTHTCWLAQHRCVYVLAPSPYPIPLPLYQSNTSNGYRKFHDPLPQILEVMGININVCY
jgi:hypothetical protein